MQKFAIPFSQETDKLSFVIFTNFITLWTTSNIRQRCVLLWSDGQGENLDTLHLNGNKPPKCKRNFKVKIFQFYPPQLVDQAFCNTFSLGWLELQNDGDAFLENTFPTTKYFQFLSQSLSIIPPHTSPTSQGLFTSTRWQWWWALHNQWQWKAGLQATHSFHRRSSVTHSSLVRLFLAHAVHS